MIPSSLHSSPSPGIARSLRSVHSAQPAQPVPPVHSAGSTAALRSPLLTPIALALLLAACGGSHEPASPTAATATTTATATATATAKDVVASSAGDAPASVATKAVGDFVPPGYQLHFFDEFNGSSLDRSRWCTRFPYGSGPAVQVMDTECTSHGQGTLDFLNDEQQRYVDFNTAGAPVHVVSGGQLKLMATRTRPDGWVSYEAGMIRSKEIFRPDWSHSYYVTARLDIPSVKGTWPAFWLVPTVFADGKTSWPPEIDIMEAGMNGVEDTADMIHMGAKRQNWGGWGPAGAAPVTFNSPDFEPYWGNYKATGSLRNRWVEIGLEWTANSTCYFVDGKKVLCEDYRWVGNDGAVAPPAVLILNLAIGGHWAGRHGIDAAAFPTSLGIDHVRVYKKTH